MFKYCSYSEHTLTDAINHELYMRHFEPFNDPFEWPQTRRIFSPKESSLLQIASQIPLKLPREKQSILLTAIEQKAIEDGFVS